MTTLETLLHDPEMAGVWNLVPDRSAITFRIKNMWGLLTVRGRFTDFTVKGVTAQLPLPVTILELDDGSIRITGETTLDRARFDLGWNRFGMIGRTATAAADVIFVRDSQ
ncbi:YceI family protein [Mycobacterium avium]|uniref:YceI family protein n=1 Tax=Mycobacterium avium TaxID=1764 RepID=UPI000BB08BDB|nr:YceI family protein [Mycobacterium avium]MDO2372305.1 YceI family protein [Mycobacterium avium subsp. hominissuis]MDO2387271.1 YceI family protein [Mycobacterium avium subsp. hominissuis]PBA00005.1 hypothetical protein CKJ74_17945 [Mycobacterium avium]PBA04768.1 hypothetical protein CKJ73_17775 [Mycobacterium avium]